MKNKMIALLLMLFSITISAQERTENVGTFDEIKIFNGLKVQLEKSDRNDIEITGRKADDVVIKNNNGTLKLSLKITELFSQDDVKIKIYFNDAIHVLDANEGSVIKSDDTFSQDKLTIKVQEGAYINVPVNVTHLSIKSVTGGNITANGTATNQDVEVTTGGVYEGYDVDSEYANVVAASGGKAEVYVTKLLDAKVRLEGNIYYKGNPDKVLEKKAIGGKIVNKQ